METNEIKELTKFWSLYNSKTITANLLELIKPKDGLDKASELLLYHEEFRDDEWRKYNNSQSFDLREVPNG